MKANILKILGVLFLIIVRILVFSQSQNSSISLPYHCGFEDSIENSNWIINSGGEQIKCQDQWMIGNLDYTEGYQSMYISCDTGKTITYGAKPNYVIAYRPILITDSIKDINISFYWKGLGKKDVSNLKYYFMPASAIRESDLKSVSGKGSLPNIFKKSSGVFYASDVWTFHTLKHRIASNTEYYLIFIWQNNNTNLDLVELSACIDDIQITDGGAFNVESLSVSSTCDTLVINWDGPHSKYDLEYRRSGSSRWSKYSNLEFIAGEQKQMIITPLAEGEGTYDVRVRGWGNDEGTVKSAWIMSTDNVCFCPDRHCINYVDLTSEKVHCFEGHAVNPLDNKFNLTECISPIDYGSNDSRSRHTVNWKLNEKDPRTGNILRTIPEGALASVRLGNWESGALAEGITYDYYVDTANAIIVLMKYAVVLEAPGHGQDKDPFFKLELIDEQGNLIDSDCGSFDFTPENEEIKWEKYKNYVWKDWTSIGLNLQKYHGQNIKIRLITQDCTESAHGGYAYFTLDCIDAKIKTESCGDNIDISMEAPEGFRYMWTKENRDSVISTSREFSVPSNDTATYYCTVSYLDVEGCEFELSTYVEPQFPFPDFEWEWRPEDCENRVYFTNKSCVLTRIDGEYVPTSKPCETFYWNINDGILESQEENIVYKAPRTGCEIEVTLVAGISGGNCEKDTTIKIVVPPIYDHLDTIYKVKCDADPETFDNQLIFVSGVYVQTLKNIWGCDSVTVLDLQFLPLPDDVHIYDTICSSDVYDFYGEKITEAGDYTKWLTTALGCDSIVHLHLEKAQAIEVSIDEKEWFVCADEKELLVDYKLTDGDGSLKTYSILFDAFAKQNGFKDLSGVQVDDDEVFRILLPMECRPNHYKATIEIKDTTKFCDDVSIPIDFDVYYSSSILEAKFGNLITFYDSTYNGGYSFVENEYRWYKNNELLVDDTLSYVYLGDNVTFNGSDCYYLEVKRKDDGVVMRTCEICPEMETGVDDVVGDEELIKITTIEKGGLILLDKVIRGHINIYSYSGLLISSHGVDSEDAKIVAPNESGFYILQILTGDKNYVYKIWVR